MDEINVNGATVRKAFLTGTHRQIPPEETLAQVRRLLPVMGITRAAFPSRRGKDWTSLPQRRLG